MRRAPLDRHGYADTFFDFAEDVDVDGRLDIVAIGLPGTAAFWFENTRTPSA